LLGGLAAGNRRYSRDDGLTIAVRVQVGGRIAFYWAPRASIIKKYPVPQLKDCERKKFLRVEARLHVIADQLLDGVLCEVSTALGFLIE